MCSSVLLFSPRVCFGLTADAVLAAHMLGGVHHVFESSAVRPGVLCACLWLRPLAITVTDWCQCGQTAQLMNDTACAAAACATAAAALVALGMGSSVLLSSPHIALAAAR